MIFLVTGSPAVGKSLFASELTKALTDKMQKECRMINLSQLVKDEKLYHEYDDRLDTIVMDDSKVKKRLKELLKKAKEQDELVVLETHTPSLVPSKPIDHVFVLRCPNTALYYDRLAARGYPPAKIEENVDCEIMQVVWDEAVERFEQDRVTVLISETEGHLQDALQEALEIIQDLS